MRLGWSIRSRARVSSSPCVRRTSPHLPSWPASPRRHSYVAAVRRELYAELTRAARLKARFFQPSFMSLLMTALQRSVRIQKVMADLVAGRQSYRGLRRRLLATLELKLMLGLFGR